jgi:type 2 lantibiotic biosynthesis protein LanM
MGPADLEQQLWFIRAALATLGASDEQGPVPVDYQPAEATLAGRAELIAAAGAIGDRLEMLAFQGGSEVGWIGLAANGDNWVLSPLGPDLYSGLPGIALFLGYLGEASGQSRYSRLAEAALETAQRELESTRRWLKLVGAFSGWGGVIYSLAHLGVLWKRQELLDEAEGLAAVLPPLIAADPYSDVMAGAAGALAALLALYDARPNPATLAMARQCGERLLGQARPMAVGAAWIGPLNAVQALAGFSHGAAGVAWALLRLAQVTGESRFRDGAWAAIAYERSLFSAEAGNWPDLRALPSGASPFRVAWCHGAAGIGLARLDALAALDHEAEREVKVALATTRREGFGRNHCLCHGDLGNAELLLLAEKRLGTGGRDTAVLAQAILAGLRQGGPRCGVPLGLETPGLMNGLAGIGYGLLRLADSQTTPSLLLLEPPRGLDQGESRPPMPVASPSERER